MSIIVMYQLCTVASVCVGVYLAARASARPLALFIVLVSALATGLFAVDDSPTSDTAGFIKFLCEMPLGLGSLVAFQCLPPSLQVKWHRVFVQYVNVAVVGNIAMMVFVPDGGTMRGWTSRVACVALVIWLCQEMKQHLWMTQPFPQLPLSSSSGEQQPTLPRKVVTRPLFVFTAVPLEWVATHAVYRFVMVTLPAFDSPRYVLLEPLSIIVMIYLRNLYRDRCDNGSGVGCDTATAGTSRPSKQSLALKDYFGMSDTIVVATMGTVSHIADALLPHSRTLRSMVWSSVVGHQQLVSGDAVNLWQWCEALLDLLGVLTHIAVIMVCASFIMTKKRS